jgi:hypothetical protein
MAINFPAPSAWDTVDETHKTAAAAKRLLFELLGVNLKLREAAVALLAWLSVRAFTRALTRIFSGIGWALKRSWKMLQSSNDQRQNQRWALSADPNIRKNLGRVTLERIKIGRAEKSMSQTRAIRNPIGRSPLVVRPQTTASNGTSRYVNQEGATVQAPTLSPPVGSSTGIRMPQPAISRVAQQKLGSSGYAIRPGLPTPPPMQTVDAPQMRQGSIRSRVEAYLKGVGAGAAEASDATRTIGVGTKVKTGFRRAVKAMKRK